MKRSLIMTLGLILFFTSCGQKNGMSSGEGNRQFVLGAFQDITTTSTFDESKLLDLPRVINFSDEMTSVKDQGNRGTCTYFSLIGVLEGVIKQDLKLDVNFSEEFLVHETKTMMLFPNEEESHPEYNSIGIAERGLLLEKDWSYQPSWFDKGFPCEKHKIGEGDIPSECFSHNDPDENALKKVISSENIKFGSFPKNTNEIIKNLAKYKHPLTIALIVNFNGWADNGTTYYDEKLRAECLKTPSKCGGHTVILTGYDLDKKIFFFKNSWGKAWGQKGYGTVPFETVDKYVNDNLYFASVKKINLPKDFDKDPFKLEALDVSHTFKKEEALSVTIKGKLVAAKGRILRATSAIVARSLDDKKAPSLTNTLYLGLKKEEEALVGEKILTVTKRLDVAKNLLGTDKSALTLVIDAKKMNQASVIRFIESGREVFVRTTIDVFTDEEGYKTLESVYTPLKLNP